MLANLTPADFDLEAGTVTLAAKFNKSRRLKVQPLPADVVAALRDYLTGKPASLLIWGGTWATDCRGAEMLRVDLEAAGIDYTTEGPEGPEYADFHSLRHSFLTLGGRSGIDLRTLQELAGHSDPHRPLFAPPVAGPGRGREQAPEPRPDDRRGGNSPSQDQD